MVGTRAPDPLRGQGASGGHTTCIRVYVRMCLPDCPMSSRNSRRISRVSGFMCLRVYVVIIDPTIQFFNSSTLQPFNSFSQAPAGRRIGSPGRSPGIRMLGHDRAPQEIYLRGTPCIGAQRGERGSGEDSVSVRVRVRVVGDR